jgi:phospholipase C
MSARPRRRAARRKPRARARATARRAAAAAGEPIRHVVLLMLENRSFDQMLGALQAQIPQLDGVPPNALPRFNDDPQGQRYLQQTGAPAKVKPDPPHDHPAVVEQLEQANGRFVKSYARAHPETTQAERQQVMACYAPDELLALHALARQFVVCDGWHSSVPGPTWTNRLFAMSGTSLGRVKMPTGIFEPNLHAYAQPSVFRRLGEAERSHRIYFGDFPLALLLKDRRSVGAARHFARLDRFVADAKRDESDFPELAFLEPDYLGPGANDDHPPHDVRRGQALVADVYEAIRDNEALWRSTLLVVTYDEHGGFYDHVVPPPALPPDGHREEYDFNQLGVRVPAILVSPWLDPGVLHGAFDHTSLLRMLQKAWGLGDLGARVAAATSPLDAIALRTTPRADAPRTLPRPPAAAVRKLRAAAPEAAEPLNDHQRAILAFSEYLEVQTKTAAAETKLRAAARKLAGPAASAAVARERALRYLRERGAPL